MANRKSKKHSERLRVTNSFSIGLKFYLEPWGDESIMPPGATYVVEAEGPEGDNLEVDFRDDGISVWAWPGSVASVIHDGSALIEGGPPVPEVPTGKTVRNFLE